MLTLSAVCRHCLPEVEAGLLIRRYWHVLHKIFFSSFGGLEGLRSLSVLVGEPHPLHPLHSPQTSHHPQPLSRVSAQQHNSRYCTGHP